MKISMVSEHASPLAALGEVDAGGQNVHVAELSAGLARAGHEVTVYTRRDDPDQPDELTMPGGYRVIHVPAGPPRHVPKDELLPFMGEFTRFLRERWELDRPDVVHAHFWMSGLASLMAARPAGIPVVQTFHALGVVKRRYQGAHDTSPSERIGLERLIGRHAARIAATCSDEVFELVRMGLPRSRMSVVPCGVDLTMFTPSGPKQPRGNRYRIVSVGRLVPRKGFDVAIAALRSLPETELVIVGGPREGELAEDPEARRLLRFAAELGVDDRVRLTGRITRTDMPSLLRSADVVVCTPWYEPFGIVPLEAMACGIPVVASAVGGLTDTIVDGVTGTHVPPRRADAVAAAVRRLLSDAALRDAYGIAGADRARCRYSWDRIAADASRVYERAVPTAVVSGEETG
ncbi:glycosyltransferase [Saccharomonospora viridis]|jgi:glycosyltransferase involved in cell wall biosynthesis|uniref:Glycosyltransferase n=2 Tax=Saccharomonospora viridis TaxID=1852 RepID=C7MZS1_SACVD|nr:glycosyltransferase [Saccharomonospora viridis]ACU96189.1 glycosyltransferase [Saccharomonospora viridis DSM 43017]KHF45305.1 glycosyl transferase [Saccharomonospora viridis]SFP79664.1 Glycosyltransferase involved in cell wall bisynthesis [Saccharomonospora viridis]